MELIDEIAQLTREIKETAHVGRTNRLSARQKRLYERAETSVASAELFRDLLNHPDPNVQLTTAWHCGWRRFMVQDAEAVVNALVAHGGEIGSRAERWLDSRDRMAAGISRIPETTQELPFPAAPICRSRDAVIAAIRSRFSGRRIEEISALIRRAVLLRPIGDNGNPVGSSFGGLPATPSHYSWPHGEEEPLLFLGQINCAELHAAIGDTSLPKEGLILFFGDHDDVHGCFPTCGCAVEYFANVDEVRRGEPPDEDFEPHVRCGLAFHETMELSHPWSSAIASLALDERERELYEQLYSDIEGNWRFDTGKSKLFGWPNLVQGDLAEHSYASPDCDLLLQLGEYHDGSSWQSWGPGGLVYFLIKEEGLVDRSFGDAEIIMQCT